MPSPGPQDSPTHVAGHGLRIPRPGWPSSAAGAGRDRRPRAPASPCRASAAARRPRGYPWPRPAGCRCTPLLAPALPLGRRARPRTEIASGGSSPVSSLVTQPRPRSDTRTQKMSRKKGTPTLSAPPMDGAANNRSGGGWTIKQVADTIQPLDGPVWAFGCKMRAPVPPFVCRLEGAACCLLHMGPISICRLPERLNPSHGVWPLPLGAERCYIAYSIIVSLAAHAHSLSLDENHRYI